MNNGQASKTTQMYWQDTLEDAPKPKGRLLGLDLGQKTIGLAVSDDEYMIAVPLLTIKRTKFSQDILQLESIIKDYEIGGYVIGWPLNMDGSPSEGCDRSQSFADEMQNYPEIFGENPWILFWDERLSTEAVKEMVDISVDIKKSKTEGHLDALAAQVVLQNAIDAL